MDDKSYSVYIHTFPNKKVYIGITCQIPYKRWAKGKGYKCNEYLTNAIEKYGWDNVTHKILYENLSKKDAEEKEIELIKLYDSTNRNFGYNIQEGGSCSTLNENSKLKISEHSKKMWLNQEYKDKQSKSHQGQKPWNKGVIMPEEFKQKCRENTYKRLKKASWNLGKKRTKDQIEKISIRHKGKKLSDEHRRALHEGSKKAGKNRQRKILCVETGVIYDSIKDASDATKIHRSNISGVARGKRLTAGGYSWKYID